MIHDEGPGMMNHASCGSRERLGQQKHDAKYNFILLFFLKSEIANPWQAVTLDHVGAFLDANKQTTNKDKVLHFNDRLIMKKIGPKIW